MSKISGIYAIICLENGKYYVGSSHHLLKRKQQHFAQLSRKTHPNIHLQNSFDLYGKEKFIFVMVEEVTKKEKLLRVEQKYLNYAADNRYQSMNLSFIAGKIQMTPEVKQKIRSALLGKKHSQETINKRRVKMIGNNFSFGTKRTKEERLKLSKLMIGNKIRLGIKHTIESKKSISEGNSKSIAQIDSLTQQIIRIFPSGKDANKALLKNKTASLIPAVARGDRKSAYGFKWQYIENLPTTHYKKFLIGPLID